MVFPFRALTKVTFNWSRHCLEPANEPHHAPPDSLPNIYLYRDPIDFRKSYRGIGAIIELELGHNPFSGSLYIFVNRARNKIRCMFWETNGFVLYYKSLSEEKYKWPKGDTELMTLTGQEINYGKSGLAQSMARELMPDRIVETYLLLHRQHWSTWAFEMVLRPWVEKW